MQVHSIFSKEDLDQYICENGPFMELTGNIARRPVTIDLRTVQEDMFGMRGFVRVMDAPDVLVRKVETGDIHEGDAIFMLRREAYREEELAAMDRAVSKAKLPHILLIFSSKPVRPVSSCVNAWYESFDHAMEDHADVMREGDRVEYDVTTQLFGADLIDCLDHRIGENREKPFWFQKMANDIWIIGEEYTRMFLILGTERALLIDAGFGYGDMHAAVRELTDLPVDVALTHGHFDHAGAIRFFDKVYLNEKDYPAVEVRQGKEILSRLLPLEDGKVFDLGGRQVRTISLPGHSAGSVVFWDSRTDAIFAGDSLLKGPFFLLTGKADIQKLCDGLEKLWHLDVPVKEFYPSHRELFPMSVADVKEVQAMLKGILDDTIPGCPTWIAPMTPSPYKTYHYGRFSAYCR